MHSIKINSIVLSVIIILVITIKSIICAPNNGDDEDLTELTPGQLSLYNSALKKAGLFSRDVKPIVIVCTHVLKSAGFNDAHDTGLKALAYAFQHLTNKVVNTKAAPLITYFQYLKNETLLWYRTVNKEEIKLPPPDTWCIENKINPEECITQTTEGEYGIDEGADTETIFKHIYLRITIDMIGIREHFKEYIIAITVLLLNKCGAILEPPFNYCESNTHQIAIKNLTKPPSSSRV